ncbi:LPS export ABC transporter permease LptG [Aquabacterium sp.]|uniref:LPS export ABC transporter permease LptG n=1 Tax=Aquabacterium sp. TaxID=1872578 RepID=UPI002CD27C17|nr:LPS export ABC transporter permease LptG [Aquabacterium sp.]HSW07032.1 LPS export ABC transporter permease LptG [Aquabacterium sp.]
MKTVRRLLYRDIVWSVAFVAIAFLSLFFFIDVVDDLDSVGREDQTLGRLMLRAVLEIPGHFYELFPIAVLIGTIYSMARLAQSSEFTILRTGGLGPGRALALLAVPGVIFAAMTFVVGDYVSPWTEREAVLLKTGSRGSVALGRGGAWLKERRDGPEGQRNVSVNVSTIGANGDLQGIRIFEFDAEGRLRTQINARAGRVGADSVWRLADASRTDWPTPEAANAGAPLAASAPKTLMWPSTLDTRVVAAALLPAQTMSTVELWRYSAHLTDQDQATQRHEIQFWKKALYPLACIVMVALALPFAYLHARAGGVSFKVFGGIMLGIGFVLLNNVSGHVGLLKQWTPWLVAAAPSLLFLLLSMGAFAWLVRYR